MEDLLPELRAGFEGGLVSWAWFMHTIKWELPIAVGHEYKIKTIKKLPASIRADKYKQ